jgi:maltooligosyltrehalose trehalohydrolase
MARHGFLYQGQRYSWQKHRRGTPSLDIPPEKFVCYLQNHDQIANSQSGARLRCPPLTALLLLGANTPLLFQGEEFGATTPFLYFADHKAELAEAVAKGRREFLAQFPSVDVAKLDRPDDPRTFERSKLDWSERERHADVLRMYRELLRLRRPATRVDGAVLAERAFVIRLEPARLIIVNLGDALRLDIVPEPLLARPADGAWKLVWSTAEVDEVEDADGRWLIPSNCAVVMDEAPAAPDR